MANKLNVVTGATGLLGSHIVEKLVARGEHVRALVRPTSEVAFLKGLGVELVQSDLHDSASLAGAVANAEIVYHCAARVGDWGSWGDFRSQVVESTRNLVAACRGAGVGRFLHVSSVSVYGHPRAKECIDETEPQGQRLRFLDHYCRAKMQAEEEVRELGSMATIVRPSWIYGPRDRNGLPRLVKALRGGWVKILGSGSNRLNIVYAGDVAAGAIAAAHHPAARGEAFHLCSEGEITQRQFLDTLTSALHLPRIERHVAPAYAYVGGLFGDVVARLFHWNRPPYISRYSVSLMARPVNFSIAKARTQLAWQPQTRPEEGLRRSLEWLHSTIASSSETSRSLAD
jgi:2-alkyl-3-oxoalkanoate reductase